MIRLHTSSDLAALALAEAEHSIVLVVDDAGRPVTKDELRRRVSRLCQLERSSWKKPVSH
jgi:hypothetical protein